MGFLDKLFSQETKNLISNVMDSVVDNVQDALENATANIDNTDYANPAYSQPNTMASHSGSVNDADETDCCGDEAIIRARVEKVAAEEWSEYELRQNISSEEMGGSELTMDYTYGLYKDGMPVAMILILDNSAAYRRKNVRLAHEVCKMQNVYCMNLLPHLPNRRSYISQQLQHNIVQ